MLAVVLRWVFQLDVELHWAACLGALSLLLQPWLNLHGGPPAVENTLVDLFAGAVVALALIGIVQVLRSR
jgi:uncharacterized membrane protein